MLINLRAILLFVISIFILTSIIFCQGNNPPRLAILSGTVMSENDMPLDNIEITKIQIEPVVDTETVTTSADGVYSFDLIGVVVSGVEDTENVETTGSIKYMPDLPSLRVLLKKHSNVQIYISDILGQEKNISDKELNAGDYNFDINLVKNYASGIYIVAAVINGHLFANKLLKTGEKYSWGMIEQKINNAGNLHKPTATATVLLNFKDLRGKHYSYYTSDAAPIYTNKDTTCNMYLLTAKQLDHPFITLPYPPYIYDTLKTMRRLVLWFYQSNWPGAKNAFYPAPTPWQAFLDTANMPPGTKDSIRNSINYMLNITGIQLEQLWNEVYYSIIPYTIPQMVVHCWYDTSEVFDPMCQKFYTWQSIRDIVRGYTNMTFNKDSLKNTDFGKATRIMLMQALISPSFPWITDTNYFDYISNWEYFQDCPFDFGPVDYPTPDEVQLIKWFVRLNTLKRVLYIGYDILVDPDPVEKQIKNEEIYKIKRKL